MKIMSKETRKILIFLLVIAIVFFFLFVGSKISNFEISVYRTSAENGKSIMFVYTDFVKSEKRSVEQPCEFPSDMQYIVTVKCHYDRISASVYKSEQRKWEDVQIVDLGNDQYSIDAIPVFYNGGYGHRTVTYCISIEKGENIQKYFFSARHE